MYIANKKYIGLPRNFNNGYAKLIAENGIRMTHDAFWRMMLINKKAMFAAMHWEV